MKFEIDKVTIFVPELLKQTCKRHHLEPMVLMRYSDTDICALSPLEKYREVSGNLINFCLVLWNHTNQFPPQLFSGGAYQHFSTLVLI